MPLTGAISREGHSPLAITALTGLEGRTDCIGGVLRLSRTYMDAFGVAVAFAVVVCAVLNRAVDALDVLVALSGFVHHDLNLISYFIYSKNSSRRIAKAM